MGSRKASNLMRMWRREGYKVGRVRHVTFGGTTVSATVYFEKNGNPVVFKDEWATLKTLADRQGFYCFPVQTGDSANHSAVYMILKNRIYHVHQRLGNMLEGLYGNYWYIQKDDAVIGDLHNLRVQRNFIREFQGWIADMNKGDIDMLLEDGFMKGRFSEYVEKLTVTLEEMKDSGKFEHKELLELEFLVNEYQGVLMNE